jgi:hypothetical protein
MKEIEDMKGEPQKPAIRVSEETRERVANFGKAGESLETALMRALDLAEECQKKKAGRS